MFSFTYKGVPSTDYKIRVSKVDNLSTPKRNVQSFDIDGRDGSLLIDDGTYKNRIVGLECQVIADSALELNTLAEDIAVWLQDDIDYYQLVLSDNPDVYYKAVCLNTIDISRVIKQIGIFKLVFECLPHKRLASGDTIVTATLPTTYVTNPTGCISKPLYVIYGTGTNITITINGGTPVVITTLTEMVKIDTDLMDTYRISNGALVNENDKLEGNYDNLYLDVWDNEITITGGTITKVEIIPRWRKI